MRVFRMCVVVEHERFGLTLKKRKKALHVAEKRERKNTEKQPKITMCSSF